MRRPVFANGDLFRASGVPRSVVKQGFVCLVYLDDIIVFVRADPRVRVKLRLIFALLACFGLNVNRNKSDFRPRSVREHLGILVDLTKREFSVSHRKLGNLQGRAVSLAQAAAKHRRWVSKLELASFAGYVVSLSVAIPLARFHLLPLYDSLQTVSSWAPHV